jgi:mono/diheme cytochrome c family protein
VKRVLPALLLGALLAGGASAQEAVDPTTLDGVYTAEQAEAGQRIYQRVCVSCHTLDWYTGDVVRAWTGGSLYGLYDVISTAMPEDNPGSLSSGEYVQVLAYILSLNGLPAGAEPLSTRRSRLRAIRFQFPEDTP